MGFVSRIQLHMGLRLVTAIRSRASLKNEGSEIISRLSGPSATVILSRHAVAPHSVAQRFPADGGVSQKNRATPKWAL